ncbi:hypothetical protein LshimejAT787_0310950 [Lyophyllum shimeji]|uniref:Uncharacterized protein n=1 Tax=Lyophyllum shimeji TaxID=47721 RepID=A0A9P3PIY1_LYOSH|nr:hypothetical protein LshimejAT787_0310950 [Lyophyllum shimeji]
MFRLLCYVGQASKLGYPDAIPIDREENGPARRMRKSSRNMAHMISATASRLKTKQCLEECGITRRNQSRLVHSRRTRSCPRRTP